MIILLLLLYYIVLPKYRGTLHYRYILRYINKLRMVFSDFLHELKSNLFQFINDYIITIIILYCTTIVPRYYGYRGTLHYRYILRYINKLRMVFSDFLHGFKLN